MREILFRGKAYEGEWVQGTYYHQKEFYGDETDFHYIIESCDQLEDNMMNFSGVIPETIGQYTGLTDKNGTKIFEGDIVEGHCHSQWSHRLQRCVVEYDRDSFKSRHYLNYPDKKHYFEYKVLFSKDVVVIGNIYDNPELLESEVDNE